MIEWRYTYASNQKIPHFNKNYWQKFKTYAPNREHDLCISYTLHMNFHNFSILLIFSLLLMEQITDSSLLLVENIVQPSVIIQWCGSITEVSMTSLLELDIAELIGYFIQFTSIIFIWFVLLWYGMSHQNYGNG